MTLDGFPLRKVILNFFVYSVTSCQPELALQLMMGFNPDLTQMLVNSYCFWASCLPYRRCWWVTFWLIWQDFPGGITASYLSEDYRIICFNRQLPFPVDDVTQRACQKIILYSNRVAHIAGKHPDNLLVCARNKQTDLTGAPATNLKETCRRWLNVGQRDQTCWEQGERRWWGCRWRAGVEREPVQWVTKTK